MDRSDGLEDRGSWCGGQKGDVLVKLDTEKLEEQIREQELAACAELAFKLAEEEFQALEKARRSISRWLATPRLALRKTGLLRRSHPPTQHRLREVQCESAEFNLEYNQKSSIVEEDVCRRRSHRGDRRNHRQNAPNTASSPQTKLESTRNRSKRSLTTTLPRTLADQRQAVEQARIECAGGDHPAGRPEEGRLDLEAQRRALAKSAEKLADLKADLKTMTITAPHDGIVYYGAAVRGKWLTTANIEKKLRPPGKLMPHEVIITVVQRSPLNIRTAVAENQLQHLAPGQKAKVSPTSAPDTELTSGTRELSYVPLAGNTFDAVFSMPSRHGKRLSRHDRQAQDRALQEGQGAHGTQVGRQEGR